MAIGVAIISLVSSLGRQMEKQLTGNITGIDMVLGAKGSPLQLILSAVFHLDAPTGNIPLNEALQYAKNPLVKNFIPLSYGDNFEGFRIIGTDKRFISFYFPDNSESFPGEMEVLLGNQVAESSGLKTGDTFESSHGLDAAGDDRHEHPYKVAGILPASGTVADRLVITPLESVWHLHEHGDAEPEDLHQEITAALVTFRSPMGTMTIPRQVNENSSMQAALPSIEINRLLSLFDSAIQIARYLAYLIVVVSGISVFISLYNSLKDQRNEKALMMSLGAARSRVFGMLLLEGITLSVLGYVGGILLGRWTLWLLKYITRSPYLQRIDLFENNPAEIYLLVLALVIGAISATLPALGVYRINIAQTLARD
jgi:putative ABC transport system permease protein